MRGRGDQPARHQGGRRSRSTRRRSEVTGVGAPTGVFSTVGAEPRSSWTVPGDVVIPNPSVDPAARSWVDPDVVPGVLGPPQANPTRHSALPVDQPASLDGVLGEAKVRHPGGDRAAGSGDDSVGASAGVSELGPAADRAASVRNVGLAGTGSGTSTGTGLLDRSGLDGQTGPIGLAREPRTQLVGALVALVVVILLLGRLGDLLSPKAPVGPGMGLGAASEEIEAPSGEAAPNPEVTVGSLKADGGGAPQLVAIGIGGDLTAERVQRWGQVGDQTNARFTFFPSVTGLLGPVGIDRYRQPGPDQATLPSPVSPSDDEARRLVGELASALVAGNAAGHETAGWLGPDACPAGKGSAWTATDWSSELGQLRSVAAQPSAYNAWSDESPDLFGGGLNGATSACAPAAAGSTPGAQNVGPGRAAAAAEADLAWTLDAATPSGQAGAPLRTIGLWRFSPVPGSEATVGELVEQLETSLSGERTPFVVSLDPRGTQPAPDEAGALEFARVACGRSEVRCVTFSEAARYLDANGPTPTS